MSRVFFIKDLSAIDKIFDTAELGSIIAKDNYVALKIHFGERGNQAYLKPERVKAVVKKVRAAGGRPFWTDTNTLYHGSRGDTLAHLQTAFDHGYTFNKTGAHVLIADGLKGLDQVVKADTLIAISHFKGHEATGFGGALKNIGMGLASKAEKLEQHSDCPNCPELKTCDKKKTLSACWQGSSDSVQTKIARYAGKFIARFMGQAGFINLICDVSPNCDCYPTNGPPIVPDVGIMASFDPVALDQASVDMVNKVAGKDILKEIWPKADWSVQLKHAEETGLGSRKYELIEI